MATNLYELIGGRSKVQQTVALFYDRVLVDPRLRPFFENVNMDGLRARQSMFLTMLLGGSRTYGGREIQEAHAGARALGLNDSHFDLLMYHFRVALNESDVGDETIEEILSLLEGTRKDVLGA